MTMRLPNPTTIAIKRSWVPRRTEVPRWRSVKGTGKYRLNAAKLKPLLDWVQAFERCWRRKLSQIKERAERKALEQIILNENEPRKQ